MAAASHRTVQVQSTTGGPRWIGILFGLVFSAVGLVGFWFLTVSPWMRHQESAAWERAPAVVMSSELLENDDDDSTTYKVRIEYRYTFGGREYTSDRSGFADGYTNIGVGRMRRTVAENPPGREIEVFVDPRDPASAVIDRSFPVAGWFGFLTLLFPAFGVFVIMAVGRTRSVSVETAAAPMAGTAVELSPEGSRWGTLIGTLAFALIWNGIVGVFVYKVVDDFRDGSPSWFLAAFLVPFVLIGLLVIYAIPGALLRVLQPRTWARIDAGQSHPGGHLPVEWRLGHVPAGVRRLRLWLEAREEAHYRRGTDNVVDKSVFLRVPVVEVSDRLAMGSGRAVAAIPVVAPPTFDAPHNKILWTLRLSADGDKGPKVEETFKLTVHGAPAGGFVT